MDVNTLKDLGPEELLKDLSFRHTLRLKWVFRFCQILQMFAEEGESKKKMLDLGCSTGKLIYFYIYNFGPFMHRDLKGIEYLGVDLEIQQINKAKKLLSRTRNAKFKVNFTHNDVSSKAFWDSIGKYDFIVASEIIEHIDVAESKNFVEQCYNHLNDDGVLIITTPVHYTRDEKIFLPKIHNFEFFYDDLIDLINVCKFNIFHESGWKKRSSNYKKKFKLVDDNLYNVYNKLIASKIPSEMLNALFDLAYSKQPEQILLACRKINK